MLAFNLGVECVGRGLELVAASGVAEADDLAPVTRQAIRADRLAGPGADIVDAIFETQGVGQASRVLRQLLGLGDRLVDPADHVEGSLGQVVVLAVDDRLE